MFEIVLAFFRVSG